MIVAAVMLLITYKLKQPMVIGYLIAGMIIGPHIPPFGLIHDVNVLNSLAELGIIMLMFVIGTEFPIAKLRSVGKVSVITALSESLVTLTIIFVVCQNFGFSFTDSIFLALAMSITSTVITVKVLEELGLMKKTSPRIVLGMLIVEDVFAVSALGVLQSVGKIADISPFPILISLAIVSGFIGSILILGSKFLPKVIDRMARTNDYAILLITILGLAFGLSFAGSQLGLSVVIGAFLAGVLVAESNCAPIARVVTVPIRDVFAALFFVSVGALMDISEIPQFIVPAIILIVTSFATKTLVTYILLTKLAHDSTVSIRTGLQIASAKGEMSLVVIKGGQDIGLLSSFIFPIMGVVTIVTTFMTPYIFRLSSRIRLSSSEKMSL
jgi:CPA2 family monovalent cation:H+ antiporter-2